MTRKIALIWAAIFLFAQTALAGQPVKPFPPQVAGTFYPADKDTLSRMVDDFIGQAKMERIEGHVVALISPHAGYVYSGAVAGYGYRAVKDRNYKTVIVIAPSHHRYFDGISVYETGSFQTPLGEVAIDSEFAKALIGKHEKIRFYREAFGGEHALEVQIPFLQRALKDFKIVPIVMGDSSYPACRVLAAALKESIGAREDVLLIASTDMSHFHPYEEAVKIDRLTLSVLNQFSPDRLWIKVNGRECELCGSGPVITTLLATKEHPGVKVRTLAYANSGDVTGDHSRVVGYGSLVIYREKKEKLPAEKKGVSGEKSILKKEDEKMLNAEQRKRLLKIARSTIEEYLRTGRKRSLTETDPDLTREQGAFVTLRQGEALRGCIGNLAASTPLCQSVQDMAIQAACGDPRFPPVTSPEMENITIEISVLSPLKKIAKPDEIKLGEHGVMVRRGFASGVFLPQVAEETGWSREEFLSNLCSHKAGLPPDAWKSGDVEIYIFTAEVFDEQRVLGK